MAAGGQGTQGVFGAGCAVGSRQRGYAGRLTLHLIGTILARGEVPMLHCSADNVPAIRLYEQLGFKLRCINSIQVVKFVGAGGEAAPAG